MLLTAVENGGAGTVSRRSKMAAHNRAVLCEGTIEESIPETAHQAEPRSSGVRRDDGCGHPLDVLEK